MTRKPDSHHDPSYRRAGRRRNHVAESLHIPRTPAGEIQNQVTHTDQNRSARRWINTQPRSTRLERAPRTPSQSGHTCGPVEGTHGDGNACQGTRRPSNRSMKRQRRPNITALTRSTGPRGDGRGRLRLDMSLRPLNLHLSTLLASTLKSNCRALLRSALDLKQNVILRS